MAIVYMVKNYFKVFFFYDQRRYFQSSLFVIIVLDPTTSFLSISGRIESPPLQIVMIKVKLDGEKHHAALGSAAMCRYC